jgi:hypothetical protein
MESRPLGDDWAELPAYGMGWFEFAPSGEPPGVVTASVDLTFEDGSHETLRIDGATDGGRICRPSR